MSGDAPIPTAAEERMLLDWLKSELPSAKMAAEVCGIAHECIRADRAKAAKAAKAEAERR